MKKYKPETFGVMLDLSRNAVMSLPSFKKYLGYLAKMGYNAVYFYNEDAYEIDGEPFFGYLRGRYTKEEMRELDCYANSLGIEIIPCIQTLAHLDSYIRWSKVPFDQKNILMVDDERTYELIENMIRTVSECFSTRRIHIGMDEAWGLGHGNYFTKNGLVDQIEIMRRHLGRVDEIVKKYGCRSIIWSDMFVRPWNKGKYLKMDKGQDVPKNVVDAVPEGVELVYWDYYHEEKEHYADFLRLHSQFNREIWFAGGVWSWRSFVSNNHYSISTMRPALDACREAGTKHIVMTIWGDNGCECSRYATLPALHYIAEYMRGNTDEEKIKAKFKRVFGADYDDFMLIDDLDVANFSYNGNERVTRKALFADLFSGFLDTAVKEGHGKVFRELSEKYAAIAKKSRKWAYLFDATSKLAACMATKYELGVKTRAAYKAGDKAELLRLANEDYATLSKGLAAYLKAFRKQWYLENKPYGFDVQELRVGGVKIRVDSCRERLIDYAKGRVEEIPELADELIEISPESDLYKRADYDYLATVSTLWGNQ